MIIPRHFHDNPDYDRLHKICPIVNAVKKNCLSNFDPGRVNPIYEAMVAYKERSSLKQYCPVKPIKREYKIWSCCDCETGYMCDFDVYTACKNLGAKVVKKLSESLKGKGHCLIFDNYFSKDLFSGDIGFVATTRSDQRSFHLCLGISPYIVVNTDLGCTSYCLES